jgi:hypothetical protein
MQTKKIDLGDGFGIFQDKSEQNESAGIELTRHYFPVRMAVSIFRLIESREYYEQRIIITESRKRIDLLMRSGRPGHPDRRAAPDANLKNRRL